MLERSKEGRSVEGLGDAFTRPERRNRSIERWFFLSHNLAQVNAATMYNECSIDVFYGGLEQERSIAG